MTAAPRSALTPADVATPVVFSHIAHHSPCSLGSIAEASGVSRPTAQRIVDDLRRRHLVEEAGFEPATIGRPSKLYARATNADLVVGIDAQPTTSHVQIATVTGLPVGAATVDHHDDDRARDEVLAAQVQALIATTGHSMATIRMLVVGVSGIVDRHGAILFSRGIPAWNGLPLAARLETLLGVSVCVANDMTLRALGERYVGSAGNFDDSVFVTNQRWFRPVVVLGGEIRSGSHDAVGEGDVFERSGVMPATLTHAGRTIPFMEVCAMVDAGTLDISWLPPFHDAFATMIEMLCFGIDPQAVIVSGGAISTAPGALVSLEERLRSRELDRPRPQIVAGRHIDAEATTGAIALALHQTLAAEFSTRTPMLPPLGTSPAGIHA